MENLIYDRTQSDVNNNTSKSYYNYNDYNRIETWCEYLAATLKNYNYGVSIVVKTNWNRKNFPSESEMERIRQNVNRLKQAYFSFTQIPENLDYMTIEKANDIERILFEIDKILEVMENNFIYCGVAGCGQNRIWQQRFRKPKTWNAQPYKLSQYANSDTLKMIATDNGINLESTTQILELGLIDKRDDVYASMKSTNNNMKIIDNLIGDTSIYVLKNILKNGKLGSSTNWTLSSYNTVSSNGEHTTIIGNVSSTGTNPNYQAIDKIFGRDEKHEKLLYVCGKARSRTTNNSYPRIYLSFLLNDITSGFSDLPSVDGVAGTALNDNEWHTFSALKTTFNSDGYYDWTRIAFGIQKNAVGEEIDFKNIAIFDLTETFGRGKEPSKAWCDANINYIGNDIVISKEVYDANN